MSTPKSKHVPVKHESKKQLVWGIVCLSAPTVLIILTICMYAIANFIASSMTVYEPVGTGPLAELGAVQPVWQVPVNVILFLIGALATMAWLPGIIIGIVLLATRTPNAKD